MKTLEMIFLGHTIVVPLFFVILAIIQFDKVKRSKKFRTTLIKFILLSFFINGIILGAIKMNNNLQTESKNRDDNIQTGEEQKNDEKTTEVEVSNSEENSNGESGDDEKKTNSYVNSDTTSKGFKIETIDGVTYIDGVLIVNKTYSLPEDYVPSGTYKEIDTTNCTQCIDKEAYEAYTKMKNDASGMSLWIASGYRSYSYQKALYNNYVDRSGKEQADTYSARAGHSEHQTGLAFDLNTVSDAFANTKEGIWVTGNCHKYGFIVRYPKGKDNETGYKYEPWHLRYVGVDLATKLYNGGDWITLEDYFGISSKYAD